MLPEAMLESTPEATYWILMLCGACVTIAAGLATFHGFQLLKRRMVVHGWLCLLSFACMLLSLGLTDALSQLLTQLTSGMYATQYGLMFYSVGLFLLILEFRGSAARWTLGRTVFVCAWMASWVALMTIQDGRWVWIIGGCTPLWVHVHWFWVHLRTQGGVSMFPAQKAAMGVGLAASLFCWPALLHHGTLGSIFGIMSLACFVAEVLCLTRLHLDVEAEGRHSLLVGARALKDKADSILKANALLEEETAQLRAQIADLQGRLQVAEQDAFVFKGKLHAIRELWDRFLGEFPAAIVDTSGPGWTIRRSNAAAAELFKATPSELVGETLVALLSARERSAGTTELARAESLGLSTQKPIEFSCSGGGRVLATAHAVSHMDDHVACTLWIIEPVGENQEAFELELSQDRFARRLVDASSELLFCIGPSKAILAANLTARSYLGLSLRDCLKLGWDGLFNKLVTDHDERRLLLARLEEALKTQTEVLDVIASVRRVGEGRVNLKFSVIPLLDKEENPTGLFVVRGAPAEAAKAADEEEGHASPAANGHDSSAAAQLAVWKGRHFDIISQVFSDTRQLHIAIREFMRRMYTAESMAECEGYMQMLAAAAEKHAEDMRRSASHEVALRTQHKVDIQPMELHGLLEPILKDIKDRADAKQVQLFVNMPPKLPLLRTDASRLRLVLRELLQNALKYSLKGQSMSVTFAPTSDGKMVRIEVQDEGPGWDANFAANLFGLFAQSPNLPTSGETSSGFGLHVARRLATQGGMRLEAYSAGTEKGAIFTLWIPVAESGEQRGPGK